MTGPEPSIAMSPALASSLRQLREDAGMTAEMVARRLGWSATKASRVERARVAKISAASLEGYMQACGASRAQRKQLRQLAAAFRGRSPGDYSSADLLRVWAAVALPEPVRTAAYTRGVLEAAQDITRMTPHEIEAAVRTARTRQAALQSRGVRGEIRICLDEGVLQHQYGSAETMAGQLAWLAGAGTLPGIRLRMLPLSAAEYRPPHEFSLYTFGTTSGSATTVLSTRQVNGTTEPDDDETVYLHQVAFRHLWDRSLPPERTLEIIAGMAEEAGFEPARA
jgi:transcriptional regulator with XRE-family HTH domain